MPESLDTDAAADAALAAALGDTPAPTPPTNGPTPPSGPAEAMEGDVLTGQSVDTRGDSEVEPCTAEEARSLVDRARSAITTISETMDAILRRRAWIPLGYDNPSDFWVKEFGPSSENPAFSRSHVYRTARILGIIYGIQTRLNDADLSVAISEYALRSLPRGESGENDEALMDSIAAGVNDLPEGFSPSDVQDVVNEKVAAAREAFAGERPEMPTPPIADRLAAFGLSLPTVDDATDDDEEAPNLTPGPADGSFVGNSGYDDPDGEGAGPAGSQSAGMGLDASPVFDASELAQTHRVQKLRTSVDALADVRNGDVDVLIERLSQSEAEQMERTATSVRDLLSELVERATRARDTVAEVAEKSAEAADGDADIDL